MKKLSTIVGLLLVASFAAAQPVPYFEGTLDEAVGQAKKDNKLVLVDFFQKGG